MILLPTHPHNLVLGMLAHVRLLFAGFNCIVMSRTHEVPNNLYRSFGDGVKHPGLEGRRGLAEQILGVSKTFFISVMLSPLRAFASKVFRKLFHCFRILPPQWQK